MHRRSKFLALLTTVVGLAVLVAVGIGGRDRIREEWYLWRLEKGGQEEEEAAIEMLTKMQSVRAVPVIVAKLRSEVGTARRSNSTNEHAFVGESKRLLGGRVLRLKTALMGIGTSATFEILKALRDETNDFVCLCLRETLLRNQEDQLLGGIPVSRSAPALLQWLRDDPSQSGEVRQVAAQVLEKHSSHDE